MARTLAQQLDAVDAAITAIEEGAQSITAEDGRTFRRGDLKALYRERERLQARINFETKTRRTVAEF